MTEKPRQVYYTTFPCPWCSKVGTLQIQQRLVARPVDPASLSFPVAELARQLDVTPTLPAALTWCMVCTAEDCDFVKVSEEEST